MSRLFKVLKAFSYITKPDDLTTEVVVRPFEETGELVSDDNLTAAANSMKVKLDKLVECGILADMGEVTDVKVESQDASKSKK